MSQSSQKLYPEIVTSDAHDESYYSNPNQNYRSSLYPSIEMRDLIENLFPDHKEEVSRDASRHHNPPSAPLEPSSMEELLIRVPGAVLNLVDKHYSVELASGDLTIIRLVQEGSIVAILACVGDIQWPLAEDGAAVKLDESHYFFSLRYDSSHDVDGGDTSLLNYGLTIASKGQEDLLKKLDALLDSYSSFSLQRVSDSKVLEGMAPMELGGKKEVMEGRCVGYWTTLAPNVEDYSSSAARLIATGSGHLIKGILWCGDVTSDRMKLGQDVMKKRVGSGSVSEIRPETLKRIKRVKKMTKMTEKVASGVLSGVVKVSGLFTSSVANSKMGKKIFGLLPGEVVLASLDGFNKVCDAVEIAGKNVMSTSSTVTTGIVSHKYGDEAAAATSEGLDAAGHAIGTAWTVFKIRKALNPKSVMKSSTLAKSIVKAGAAELKSKNSK